MTADTRARILQVDDHPFAQTDLPDMLYGSGHSVVLTADSLRQVKEGMGSGLLKKRKINFALVESWLQGNEGDGLKAALALKASGIAVLGYAITYGNSEEEIWNQAGIPTLSKNVPTKELIQTISDTLATLR